MRIHKIFNLIFLPMTFYCLITPIAFFLRLMGRDALKMKVNSTQKSYWIERASKKAAHHDFVSQLISKR